MNEKLAKRPKFDPAPCIWCGVREFEPSLEHILPDALGCPPGFFLRSEVCSKCNTKLGHLDQALLKQFEITSFFGNVSRKGRKRPSLTTFSSLAGAYTQSGPEMYLNVGPGPASAFGKKLKPLSETKEFENVSFTVDGLTCSLSFTQKFGDDPKFVRALYKVGIGVAVFWLGPKVAHSSSMVDVRRFVRKGKGQFKAIMLLSSSSKEHHFSPPYVFEESGFHVVGMRIFGIDFVVDFDPKQQAIERASLYLQEQEFSGWAILPSGQR